MIPPASLWFRGFVQLVRKRINGKAHQRSMENSSRRFTHPVWSDGAKLIIQVSIAWVWVRRIRYFLLENPQRLLKTKPKKVWTSAYLALVMMNAKYSGFLSTDHIINAPMVTAVHGGAEYGRYVT